MRDLIDLFDMWLVKVRMKINDLLQYLEAVRCAVVEGVKGWFKYLMAYERLSPQEIDDRFEVCYHCPEFRDRYLFTQCNKCKCVLEVKLTLEGAQCPLGKW